MKAKNVSVSDTVNSWERLGRAAFVIYFVAFGVELLDGVVELVLLPGDKRLSAGLVTMGYLVLHALPLYGLWFRARWAWILSNVLAVFTVVLYAFTLVAPYVLPPLYLGTEQVDQPPLQQLLGWTLVAIYSVFIGASWKTLAAARACRK
jgi:hypothetical protein